MERFWNDVWLLSLASKKPIPLPDTPVNESHPQISPDGKWIVYESDETGGTEIYVRPFPKLDGKWQISTAGGFVPRWRNDNQELYYFTSTSAGQLMAVDVKVSRRSFEPGIPERVFSTLHRNTAHAIPYNHYAVSADGQRFLITRTASSDPGGYGSSPITVTLNWPGLLKK